MDLSKGPPPISPDLVDWLEVLYPDRFPEIPDNAPIAPELVARTAGRLDVVRLLRTHLNRQTSPPKSRKNV